MADEIQEAVQIIRVAYDGIEIAMKVGSGGLSAMQKAVKLLIGMLDYEKNIGKTSMRKLLMRGGDLQVFQFKTEDMKKFARLAKKYGILYSALPDVNEKDGLSEVLFHSEAVPRVNIMLQKLGFGRIAQFDEYLKNDDEQSLGSLMEFLQGQKRGEDMVPTEEILRAGTNQELTDRIQAVAAAKNLNLTDITISKNLIAKENDHAIKTRIPGTWGKHVRYIWINKNNVMEIHSGKTLLTFLDKNKDYKIYDEDNSVVQIMKGETLYAKHYDKVEAGVRERYERAVKKAVRKTAAVKFKGNTR